MFNIAICDDEIESRTQIQSYINTYSNKRGIPIHIGIFSSGRDLFKSNECYDLYLLDIMLATENGLEISKVIRQKDPLAFIIFITNFRQYREIAHNIIHSFAYLCKPINKDDLFFQIDEVYSYKEQKSSKPNLRFFTYENGLIELNTDEIYYFEYVKKRHIKISCKNNIFHFNKKINSFSDKMLEYDFFMPHQSFIVNLKYVKDVKNYELLMVNGDRIPLSQKRAVLFKDALNIYLKKMLIH